MIVCRRFQPNCICIVLNLGDGAGEKERHAVCHLQVNPSEYINDCGLSPVLSNCYLLSFQSGEAAYSEGDGIKCLTPTEGGGQFAMFCGGGGTNRGPLLGLHGM